MKKLVLIALLAACGSKKSNEPPPAQPPTGAPVAFVVEKFTPGDDHKGSLDLKAYNFSEKKVAGYMILMRYTDASGAAIKVKQGTPFEKDFDFWSMSGNKYRCEPKSWCSMKVDDLDVPAKTAKVEVLAASVDSLKDDMHMDDQPLWRLPRGGTEWPIK